MTLMPPLRQRQSDMTPNRVECPTVEAVKVQVLPALFTLPGKDDPQGSSPTTYECWDATFAEKLCRCPLRTSLLRIAA
jgi:hypothetical protein